MLGLLRDLLNQPGVVTNELQECQLVRDGREGLRRDQIVHRGQHPTAGVGRHRECQPVVGRRVDATLEAVLQQPCEQPVIRIERVEGDVAQC